VKGILQYTAVALSQAGTPLDPLTQGTGEINAEGSVRVAALVDPAQAVGTQWVNATVADRWSFIAGAALDWSKSIIWNNVLVSGSLMDVHQPAWGFNIVWGTEAFCAAGSEDCDNIVWGTLSDAEDNDNIVWGTFAEDSDNIVWGTLSEGGEHIVWGSFAPEDIDNIVWGTNVVWDDLDGWMFNIVWGTSVIALSEDEDNIVWGTNEDLDNIVWGTYWMTPYGVVSGAGIGGPF
jgi:hypothetical protein